MFFLPKSRRLCVCFPYFFLFFFAISFSQCTSGAEACGGDPSLDPKNNCLPFSGPNDLGEPSHSPPDACEVRGEGTDSSPYKICDYWALSRIGLSREDGLPLDGVYELTGDIDASLACGSVACEELPPNAPGALPIGSAQEPFNGKLYGRGHSINGFYSNREGLEGVGLFGALGSGAYVASLNMRNVVARGSAQVGALAGFSDGAEIAHVRVSEASVYAARSNAGGLLGLSQGGGEILNSQVSVATVTGVNKVGGLVGENKASIIQGSSVAETVSVSATNGIVGGLVGLNAGNARIESSHADASVHGQDNVGGLVGSDSSYRRPSSIELSYSRGNVVASGQRVGGLVGRQSASIIRNSYAKANVSGPEGNPYQPSVVGGLVGHSISSSTIERSYAAPSRVYGSSRVGGLVGHLNGGTLSDSYAGYHADSRASGMLVEGAGSSVGGLVGRLDGSGARVQRSYSAVYLVKSSGPKVGGLIGYLEQGFLQKSFSSSGLSAEGDFVGALIGHCGSASLSTLYFRNTMDAFGLPSGAAKEDGAYCYASGGNNLPEGIVGATGQYLLSSLDEVSANYLAWGADTISPWLRLGEADVYPCLGALPLPVSGAACLSSVETASASAREEEAYPSDYVNNVRVEGGPEDGEYTLVWGRLSDPRVKYSVEQSAEGGEYRPVGEGDSVLTGDNTETSWEFAGQDYGTYSYRVRACYAKPDCDPSTNPSCYDDENCNQSHNPSNIKVVRVTHIPRLELTLEDKEGRLDKEYALSWERVGGSIVRYEWVERSDNAWPSQISPTGRIQERDLPSGAEKVRITLRKSAPAFYYYRVRACGLLRRDCGEWSDSLGARVDLPDMGLFADGTDSDCSPASIEGAEGGLCCYYCSEQGLARGRARAGL